eukprot:COSAG05_NODE_124_length_17559_cov_8.898643_18_plen_147_part_00
MLDSYVVKSMLIKAQLGVSFLLVLVLAMAAGVRLARQLKLPPAAGQIAGLLAFCACVMWLDSPLLLGTHTPRDDLADYPSAVARWRGQHETNLRLTVADEPPARLVFLGDSLCEGWLRMGLSRSVSGVPGRALFFALPVRAARPRS